MEKFGAIYCNGKKFFFLAVDLQTERCDDSKVQRFTISFRATRLADFLPFGRLFA
jgi:hypothetical protein